MLIFTMVLVACQPVSRPPSSDSPAVRVIAIAPVALDPSASAQEGAPQMCQAWSVSAPQAEAFFALSEEVDGRTFHHEYDTAPCKVTGTLQANGREWAFSINGAAKATWSSGQEVLYFGCTAPACRPLVLWEFVGMNPQ